MESAQQAVAAGLDELGLKLTAGQSGQLLQYLELLHKWNQVYNLTAVRDPGQMLTLHLMDSLSVVGPLRRHTGARPIRLLDVGSGAGLPGAVIAICCPEIVVDCLDAVGKKAAFIQQSAAALLLPNLRGLHGRVQEVAHPYEVVASRAFASLADFVSWSANALAPGGAWLAMKAKDAAGEITELPRDVAVFHVEQLKVPGLDADRRLVWMNRQPA